MVNRRTHRRLRNSLSAPIVSPAVIVASPRLESPPGTRWTGAATFFVVAMLCSVGCQRPSPPATAPAPLDEITYAIPPEGFSIKRVVEDAEKLLGRTISCTECALAESRPIKIAGLPRVPRADALRMFQAIFATVLLDLVELGERQTSLLLECLDSSGRSIRKGPFIWMDDVTAEEGDAPVSAVILTNHAAPSDLRDSVTPLMDGRLSYYNELPELRGWIVRGPPATIKKVLAVVRAQDVPPEEVFTYPVPPEGLSVTRVVEDAERVLRRKIICSESALAYTRPIQIRGLPRAPRSEALRLFQALFLGLRLQLSPSDSDASLQLEFLPSSGNSIRGGGFYWIGDVATQEVQHQIKTVILLRHIRADSIRQSIIGVLAPTDRFDEVLAPDGWIVEARPATILKMLEVVRSLDVPNGPSRPTTGTSR